MDRFGTRRTWAGAGAGLATTVALSASMFPLRAHLSVATTALVLVIPVVAAVAVGGSAAGLVGMAAGFIAYDFIFIPPYYTLYVGAAQNWVALGVYAVVMGLVAQVVGRLNEVRAAARASSGDARRLFAMSDLLVQDRPVEDLLSTIVSTLCEAFDLESVALLLPGPGGLQVAASAGAPVDEAELARLSPKAGSPVRLHPLQEGASETYALASSGRPVGVMVLRGASRGAAARELLRTFANHAAIAIERAQLSQQAHRAELLEEVDRLRRSLVGAVSHDLRTPLSTIKVSTTTLLDDDAQLTEADRRELLELMDQQADRLNRLVSNLLDMTRIQAGVLEVRRRPWDVAELLDEAIAGVRPLIDRARLKVVVASDVPRVEVDHVLVGQVLANLLDNAVRHAPGGSTITVEAQTPSGSEVEVSVSDCGPGVPPAERESVFDSFVRFDTGGRSGLGLAIAKAFTEAHDQRIWADEGPSGGARFTFTLPRLGSDGGGA